MKLSAKKTPLLLQVNQNHHNHNQFNILRQQLPEKEKKTTAQPYKNTEMLPRKM